MSGAAVWVPWLLLSVAAFIVLEAIALKTERWPTLSRTVWGASKAWPPLPFVIGQITGGLAVHWWNWCPV